MKFRNLLLQQGRVTKDPFLTSKSIWKSQGNVQLLILSTCPKDLFHDIQEQSALLLSASLNGLERSSRKFMIWQRSCSLLSGKFQNPCSTCLNFIPCNAACYCLRWVGVEKLTDAQKYESESLEILILLSLVPERVVYRLGSAVLYFLIEQWYSWIRRDFYTTGAHQTVAIPPLFLNVRVIYVEMNWGELRRVVTLRPGSFCKFRGWVELSNQVIQAHCASLDVCDVDCPRD